MKTKIILAILVVSSLFACKRETANSSNKNDSISALPTKNQDTKVKHTKVDSNTIAIKECLEDFYNQYSKAKQTFVIDASKDITLKCKGGTKVTLKANSLIGCKTGKAVKGKVTVNITEYYKKSEMVMGKLSTTSNGHLLESGGMLNIEAYMGKEKLQLKNGSTALIEMPSEKANKKKDMKLFYGELGKNGLNWKLSPILKDKDKDLQDPPIIDSPRKVIESTNNEIVDVPQQQAQFPGGMNVFYDFLAKTIRYPVAAREAAVEGRVIVQFVISKTGAISNIEVVKSVDIDLDKEAIRVIKSMPNWIPAKNGDINVNTRITLPIVFKLTDDLIVNTQTSRTNITTFSKNKKSKQKFEEKLINGASINAKENITSNYIFQTTNLGWINCDRFYNYTNKINFKIKDSNPNINIYVVFKDINSIATAIAYQDMYIVQNVPLNEKVTILAFKNENNKNYMAVKETTISSNVENKLIFNPITANLLKNTFQKINNH